MLFERAYARLRRFDVLRQTAYRLLERLARRQRHRRRPRTLVSPTAAFLYAAAWMLLALTGLIISRAR